MPNRVIYNISAKKNVAFTLSKNDDISHFHIELVKVVERHFLVRRGFDLSEYNSI